MFYHAHPRLPIFGGNRINPRHPLDTIEDAATAKTCYEHQMSHVSSTTSKSASVSEFRFEAREFLIQEGYKN